MDWASAQLTDPEAQAGIGIYVGLCSVIQFVNIGCFAIQYSNKYIRFRIEYGINICSTSKGVRFKFDLNTEEHEMSPPESTQIQYIVVERDSVVVCCAVRCAAVSR